MDAESLGSILETSLLTGSGRAEAAEVFKR
jgi:hypothetical protein